MPPLQERKSESERSSAAIIPFAGKSSLLDQALSLSKAGIAVHWLQPQDKIPANRNWPTAPRATPESLRKSYKPGYNVGIRPGAPSDLGGAYLHTLDVDVRDENRAAEAYAWLDENWEGWRDFPIVLSGSGGSSRHIYFFAERAYRSRSLARSKDEVLYYGKKVWAWQIEIYGTGKQVAAPPSIHPLTGKPYRWLTPLPLDEFDLGLYPMIAPTLIDRWKPLASDAPANATPAENKIGLTIEEARRILAKLPFEEFGEDRDGWVRTGMALNHEFGEDGRELWDEFSAQSDKYNPDEQTRVWKSFRPRPDSIRMATLMSAARAVEIGEAFEDLGNEEEGGADDDLLAGATSADIDLLGGADDIDLAGAASAARVKAAVGDIDAGRRFAKTYGGQFLHVYPTRTWLRWDSVRWADCESGEEIEAAKKLARELFTAAMLACAKNPNEKNKIAFSYAQRLMRDAPRVRALLEMARSEPAMARLPRQFDCNAMLLGVKNGVLDLSAGGLVAPDTSQLIRKQCGTRFEPDAKCPRWLRFLSEIQPDPQIRKFLQSAVGYSLTGSVDEEKFFFAHGVGANGKSVFANVLEALFGDYAVTVSAQLLTKNRNESEAARLIVTLPGARLVLANETSRTDIWDDGRVKSLVSREKIVARRLFKEVFSFFPTHKLWVRGNHLPGALDDTDGFWRRLIPVPFETQIPAARRIPDLDRQIIAEELPGVLNWALEGCLAWQREKLIVPAAVRRDADAYRSDADLLGHWVLEWCVMDPNARTGIGSAYDSYRNFCASEGVSAPSKISFSKQIFRRPDVRRDASHKHGSRIMGLSIRSCGTAGFDPI